MRKTKEVASAIFFTFFEITISRQGTRILYSGGGYYHRIFCIFKKNFFKLCVANMKNGLSQRLSSPNISWQKIRRQCYCRATSLLCNFSERKTITNSITFFMKKITNSRTATYDCNCTVLQAKNITISGNYFQFQLDNVIDITNIIATLQGNISR